MRAVDDLAGITDIVGRLTRQTPEISVFIEQTAEVSNRWTGEAWQGQNVLIRQGVAAHDLQRDHLSYVSGLEPWLVDKLGWKKEYQHESIERCLCQVRTLVNEVCGTDAASVHIRSQRIAVGDCKTGLAVDTRYKVSISVNADARPGKMGACRRVGRNTLSLDGLSEQLTTAVRDVRRSCREPGPSLESGMYPVVLAPGIGALVLHEAIGHALEADFILNGVSMYSDKRACKVGSDFVTVVDSGIEPGQLSSSAIDDEGTPAGITTLIADGRVEGFLHSKQTAAAMNEKPTGNGRRESFRHQCLPRCRCTKLIGPGVESESLIGQVPRGLYIADLSDGQSDISGGEYQFIASEAYHISDGVIGDRLPPVTVMGAGNEFLFTIAGIGDDFACDGGGGGPCHKGQEVEVSFGQPTVLIERMRLM